MLSIKPHPSTRGGEKGWKGRETYKFNIKSFTHNANNTNNINNKRNNAKHTKLIRSFLELGAGALVSDQQLPGSTRKSRTHLSTRWELDSGMLGLESASGSQAGQRAGSSSEAGHGWREWDPRDPPALNWVWHATHGISHWSLSGHLFCPPLPASMILYNSSIAGPKRSVGDLGCYSHNYKEGSFSAFVSYH